MHMSTECLSSLCTLNEKADLILYYSNMSTSMMLPALSRSRGRELTGMSQTLP